MRLWTRSLLYTLWHYRLVSQFQQANRISDFYSTLWRDNDQNTWMEEPQKSWIFGGKKWEKYFELCEFFISKIQVVVVMNTTIALVPHALLILQLVWSINNKQLSRFHIRESISLKAVALICKCTISQWNFFCRWLLTSEEYLESFRF